MVDRRFRRRRSLRSVLLFATGFCSLFVCFSWYTLMCCKTNMYGGYIINNYPAYPFMEKSEDHHIQLNSADDSNPANDVTLVERIDSSRTVIHIDSTYSQDVLKKTSKITLKNRDEFQTTESSYTQHPIGDTYQQMGDKHTLEENSKRKTYNQKQTLPVPFPETDAVSVKPHSFHDDEETVKYKNHVEKSQEVAEAGLFNKATISLYEFHPKADKAIDRMMIDDTATASASITQHSTVSETNSKFNHPSFSNGELSPVTNRPQTILPDQSFTEEQDVRLASFEHISVNGKTSADYAQLRPRNPAASDQLSQVNRPQSILPVTSGQDFQIGEALNYQKATYYSHPPFRTITIRSPPTILPNSIPPTFELDRYAVKAWLPRGIKERTESSSQESSSVVNHPYSSGQGAGQRMKSNIAIKKLGEESPTQIGLKTKKVVSGNQNPYHQASRQAVVVSELDDQKPPDMLLRHDVVVTEISSRNYSQNRLRRNVVINDFSQSVQNRLKQDIVSPAAKLASQYVVRQDIVVGEHGVPSLSQHGWKRNVVVSEPVKRLPQALIIGVKKCGTRALLEFLRVHPDIRASGPETHFFDRHYQRGLEWYRHQMPASLEGQITMEKTPSYFITRDAPPRIRAALSPSARLLVVVRDPVTRAVSDYTQSASKRPPASKSTFEEMAFLNASTGLVDTSWPAIRLGVYARFLEWWTPRYFPKEQILFISGEELVRDPAAEMGRVQDFLGLKRIVSEKHFYFNETKGFPCLKKSEGSGNPHCLGKTKGRAHPDISSATIQRLRDFYRPFNVKFYQMVGRNFGWP